MAEAASRAECTLLIVAPIGNDGELMQALLAAAGVESEVVSNLEAVVTRLQTEPYAGVILAEEGITEPGMSRIREHLLAQPTWSDVPIILLLSHHSASHSKRGNALIEFFAPSGNITLMERPFHPSTLLSSVQVAMRARRRQYQMRDMVQELRFSLQQRDMFMSAASHELKTPLTSLKLQTQMSIRAIANGDKAPFNEAKVLRNIQNTERHVSRLTRLIDEMLDVTRIQVGKLSLNLERVDLKQLVIDVMDVHQMQLKDTACTFKCDETELVGNWDRFRIEQVITNLLTNALKYGHGSPVEITLRREQENAVLEVRDHGLGIAKEDHQRIFGRFERAVPGSNISGLGLGLYIARNILELHQGRISVDSAIGQGATFRVELPLSIPMAATGVFEDAESNPTPAPASAVEPS